MPDMLDLFLSLPKAYPDTAPTLSAACTIALQTGQRAFYYGDVNGTPTYIMNLAAVANLGAINVREIS